MTTATAKQQPVTKREHTAAEVAHAKELWRQSAAEGTQLTGRDLGDLFNRSDRWGRKVIATAREEAAAGTDRNQRPAPPRPARSGPRQPSDARPTAGTEPAAGTDRAVSRGVEPPTAGPGQPSQTGTIASSPKGEQAPNGRGRRGRASADSTVLAASPVRSAAAPSASGTTVTGRTDGPHPSGAATAERNPPAGTQPVASEPVVPNDHPSPSPSSGRSVATTLAVVTVAVVAAVASYDHQRLLAEQAGEGWRAWLWPLSVDGLIVAASMAMLTRRRAGLRAGPLAWVSFLAGIGASLAANVAAAEPTLIGRLVAAWPPLALLLAWELLMQTRAPTHASRRTRSGP